MPTSRRPPRRLAAAAAGLCLLAACRQAEPPVAPPSDRPRAGDAPAAAAEPLIPCARGGAPLAPACTLDQAADAGGLVLTLRHPDGAFRRLRVTRDGRGVVVADGAQGARVTIVAPGTIEVVIAGERYRLPATVQARR
jgi:hypothetical protein